MSNKNMTIIPFLVYQEDGKINKAASVERLIKAVDNIIVEREAEETLILSYIDGLFDQHKGARLNQQAIVGMVVREIQKNQPQLSDIQMVPKLSKRILEIVQAQITAGTYAVNKGPSGGTYRVADQTSSEPEQAVESAKENQ